ncbi:MAG: hypothetical protein ACPG5T_04595 [Endozoicomonas sp.]
MLPISNSPPPGGSTELPPPYEQVVSQPGACGGETNPRDEALPSYEQSSFYEAGPRVIESSKRVIKLLDSEAEALCNAQGVCIADRSTAQIHILKTVLSRLDIPNKIDLFFSSDIHRHDLKKEIVTWTAFGKKMNKLKPYHENKAHHEPQNRNWNFIKDVMEAYRHHYGTDIEATNSLATHCEKFSITIPENSFITKRSPLFEAIKFFNDKDFRGLLYLVLKDHGIYPSEKIDAFYNHMEEHFAQLGITA